MLEMFNNLDTSNWESYKCSLGQAVNSAHSMGIKDKTINKFAKGFGEFLNKHASADLPQNKALQELWQVANDDERQVLAKLMVDICDEAYQECR